ncbi:hypothetical protein HELRODRAFT_190368 [Helobdella robusta]|uniref:Major facilitator superfamily (MFS) profile domain-containing protein n=1 Tax=Helobdella robusta TaxID=6412 RepID=T1FRX7_HELRO|nr:hypothetical protein HELRODRAFT_190368 [Helobdella robusta]ESO10072.1 hypothetical protein HELRODRAFT_190368 [Helobdella robusta]
MADLLSSPIFGKISDVTGHTKWLLVFSNLLQITGSFIYIINIGPEFLIISRLITGFGSGVSTSLMADLARTTSNDQRTSTFASFMALRQFGLVIGPGCNLFLAYFDFTFLSFPINKYTSPGFFLMVLWCLHELLALFCFWNLPKIYLAEHLEQQQQQLHEESEAANLQLSFDATSPHSFDELTPSSAGCVESLRSYHSLVRDGVGSGHEEEEDDDVVGAGAVGSVVASGVVKKTEMINPTANDCDDLQNCFNECLQKLTSKNVGSQQQPNVFKSQGRSVQQQNVSSDNIPSTSDSNPFKDHMYYRCKRMLNAPVVGAAEEAASNASKSREEPAKRFKSNDNNNSSIYSDIISNSLLVKYWGNKYLGNFENIKSPNNTDSKKLFPHYSRRSIVASKSAPQLADNNEKPKNLKRRKRLVRVNVHMINERGCQNMPSKLLPGCSQIAGHEDDAEGDGSSIFATGNICDNKIAVVDDNDSNKNDYDSNKCDDDSNTNGGSSTSFVGKCMNNELTNINQINVIPANIDLNVSNNNKIYSNRRNDNNSNNNSSTSNKNIFAKNYPKKNKNNNKAKQIADDSSSISETNDLMEIAEQLIIQNNELTSPIFANDILMNRDSFIYENNSGNTSNPIPYISTKIRSRSVGNYMFVLSNEYVRDYDDIDEEEEEDDQDNPCFISSRNPDYVANHYRPVRLRNRKRLNQDHHHHHGDHFHHHSDHHRRRRHHHRDLQHLSRCSHNTRCMANGIDSDLGVRDAIRNAVNTGGNMNRRTFKKNQLKINSNLSKHSVGQNNANNCDSTINSTDNSNINNNASSNTNDDSATAPDVLCVAPRKSRVRPNDQDREKYVELASNVIHEDLQSMNTCRELFTNEIVALFFLMFVSFFNQLALETFVTPMTKEYLDWGEKENSLLLFAAGIEIILVFLLLRPLSRKIDDRWFILAGSIIQLFSLVFLVIYVHLADRISTHELKLVLFLLIVSVNVVSLPLLMLCSNSLFTKLIPMSIQGFAQGIRKMFAGAGTILGPLWTGGMMERSFYMFIIMIAINCFALALLFATFYKLSSAYFIPLQLRRHRAQQVNISSSLTSSSSSSASSFSSSSTSMSLISALPSSLPTCSLEVPAPVHNHVHTTLRCNANDDDNGKDDDEAEDDQSFSRIPDKLTEFR